MTLAVIFDIDGVLIDSYEPHFESWRRLGDELGETVTREQFAASFGRTSRDIIRLWWADRFERRGETLTDQRIVEIDERKESLYRDILRQQSPGMDGAVALIDDLRAAGFQLAVGSSGPPANVELSIAMLGRADAFAARVSGADVTRGKPDPQVFQLAAKRLGVAPARCAVIEDAPAGVEAANRADMLSIALTGTADREKLSHADHIVDSLNALNAKVIAAWIEAAS